MTAILALHSSNAQYFVLEGIDLYIGWYIDTNQLVVKLDVSFRLFENGLWSDWGPVKTIEVVSDYIDSNKLKNISIPEHIIAGQDLEIIFECEEDINYFHFWVEEYSDEYDKSIYFKEDIYTGPTIMIVPGYQIDYGKNYCLNMEVYNDEDGPNGAVLWRSHWLNRGGNQKSFFSIFPPFAFLILLPTYYLQGAL